MFKENKEVPFRIKETEALLQTWLFNGVRRKCFSPSCIEWMRRIHPRRRLRILLNLNTFTPFSFYKLYNCSVCCRVNEALDAEARVAIKGLSGAGTAAAVC